jgi:hypothetical protein
MLSDKWFVVLMVAKLGVSCDFEFAFNWGNPNNVVCWLAHQVNDFYFEFWIFHFFKILKIFGKVYTPARKSARALKRPVGLALVVHPVYTRQALACLSVQRLGTRPLLY